jgi:hypothetical protein
LLLPQPSFMGQQGRDLKGSLSHDTLRPAPSLAITSPWARLAAAVPPTPLTPVQHSSSARQQSYMLGKESHPGSHFPQRTVSAMLSSPAAGVLEEHSGSVKFPPQQASEEPSGQSGPPDLASQKSHLLASHSSHTSHLLTQLMAANKAAQMWTQRHKRQGSLSGTGSTLLRQPSQQLSAGDGGTLPLTSQGSAIAARASIGGFGTASPSTSRPSLTGEAMPPVQLASLKSAVGASGSGEFSKLALEAIQSGNSSSNQSRDPSHHGGGLANIPEDPSVTPSPSAMSPFRTQPSTLTPSHMSGRRSSHTGQAGSPPHAATMRKASMRMGASASGRRGSETGSPLVAKMSSRALEAPSDPAPAADAQNAPLVSLRVSLGGTQVTLPARSKGDPITPHQLYKARAQALAMRQAEQQLSLLSQSFSSTPDSSLSLPAAPRSLISHPSLSPSVRAAAGHAPLPPRHSMSGLQSSASVRLSTPGSVTTRMGPAQRMASMRSMASAAGGVTGSPSLPHRMASMSRGARGVASASLRVGDIQKDVSSAVNIFE